MSESCSGNSTKIQCFYDTEVEDGQDITDCVIIRAMKLKDVSPAYQLGRILFSFNSSLSRTFDRFAVIEGYTSHPEFCLVAEVNGNIIGFTLGNLCTKEDINGYLSWIAVHPDYQRKGIGSKMYAKVEERMREQSISEVLVDTPVSNQKALKFLDTMGFSSPVKHVYLSCLYQSRQIDTSRCDKNVVIRLMGLDDIYTVYQIGESVFTKQSVNLYRFWNESQVTSAYESDGDLALVAEIDNEVVGFALGSTLERIEKKFGYLIWLGVNPNIKGKGVGTLLYKEYERLIQEQYPEIRTIIIDTQESNTTAIKFFSRFGFEITDTFIYLCKECSDQAPVK